MIGLDFSEIETHLNENEALVANLKAKSVDPFTIAKIESVLVREAIIFIQASYQEQVIKAIVTKIKHRSNNDQEIVNFFILRTQKLSITVGALKHVLRNFNPRYATNFNNQLNNQSEQNIYEGILNDRINAAHNLGNNFHVGSLEEIRTAHEQAKHILKTFESCMW